ncbi:MAG: fasciclin domain-containing protein [Lewinellaceae bacterium]|nr:fasciclin domain-containing protein [Lewinellaceae bacterium]
MKINFLFRTIMGMLALIALTNCTSSVPEQQSSSSQASAPAGAGQSAVQDNDSQKDVVKVAIGSPDHTTLVTAVKAAELVDVLSNAGPFTVFAPTNAAFDLLPPGTVTDLLKPDKKAVLQDILQYHVAVAVYKTEMLQDGQVIPMANDGKVTIGVKDGKYTVNGANIIASVPASNGIVHVIDAVLLPK